MVNDLLDLTRIEQGRLRLDLRPTAPADAGRRGGRAVQGVGVGTRASRWRRTAGVELPDVLVDRERIDHVFDNLVGNALRHTPRGGTVRVAAEAEGDRIRFAVSDTGEGIAAEHLPRLFEKFYRVPGSRSEGAGLGLAITREIVQAHGGSIAVESQPGRGTTFTFWLPTAAADRAARTAGVNGDGADS